MKAKGVRLLKTQPAMKGVYQGYNYETLLLRKCFIFDYANIDYDGGLVGNLASVKGD